MTYLGISVWSPYWNMDFRFVLRFRNTFYWIRRAPKPQFWLLNHLYRLPRTKYDASRNFPFCRHIGIWTSGLSYVFETRFIGFVEQQNPSFDSSITCIGYLEPVYTICKIYRKSIKPPSWITGFLFISRSFNRHFLIQMGRYSPKAPVDKLFLYEMLLT